MFDRIRDLLKLIDEIKTLVPLDTLIRFYRAAVPLPSWTDVAAVEAWLARIAPVEAECIVWCVQKASGAMPQMVATAGPCDFDWLVCKTEDDVRAAVAVEATGAAVAGPAVAAVPLWVMILVEIAVEIWRRRQQ